MLRAIALLSALLAAACSRPENTREYSLVGQIVALAPERREVTIKHQDIVGFMPAMTMPFTVRDPALLADRQPGDLITATLVFGETTAYLSQLTRTGHQPVDAPPPDLGLREGDLVADAAFIDQTGTPRPLSSFQGHRRVLTFIYTRCPLAEYCPLMDRHFTALQRTIRARADLADVHLLSVTLDPAYDTPAVLRAHAQRLQAEPSRWSFLTGEPAVLREFASQFGIYSEADPENPQQIVHSLRTAVIDVDGRLVTNTTGNDWTPDDILAQLTTAATSRH